MLLFVASDVTAETAAALAAASIVFRDIFFDSNYSQICIIHALQLFKFAVNHDRSHGLGSQCDLVDCNLFDANISREYGDELVWASLWIYKATNYTTYLYDAHFLYKMFQVDKLNQFVSYDNKGVAVEVKNKILCRLVFYFLKIINSFFVYVHIYIHTHHLNHTHL